jgi:UDP-glucose 4-epimerase
MAILVTGGAGYIGSHAAFALLDAGREVVVVDNLSTGFREAAPKAAAFVEGDVGDRALMAKTIRAHAVTAVMHFAGSIVVPESVVQPLKYYANNTGRTRDLLETCVEAGVAHFVFSSTAAVYGTPQTTPTPEDAPLAPISPYGASKAMSERMLTDAAAAHGIGYAILRYFNVCGADPAGRAGQRMINGTHLIKAAVETAVGRRKELAVFGSDYPTRDGTAVRDYIHVSDLADAHLAALRHLEGGGASLLLNCGYGRGYTVREVLRAVEAETGRPLPVRDAPRRAGDPAELVADVSRIGRELDWRPRHDDLRLIVRTALDFEASALA